MTTPKKNQGALIFLDAVHWLGLASWFGGLFTLGALVAAVVFRRVPTPYSADAMTEVFRRFDRIALVFAGTLLLVEVARYLLEPETFTRQGGVTRGEQSATIARTASLVVAAACRAIMGFFVSPEIEALHRRGAMRGLGDDGMQLETFHKIAERLARVEFAFLFVAAIAMIVSARLSRTRAAS